MCAEIRSLVSRPLLTQTPYLNVQAMGRRNPSDPFLSHNSIIPGTVVFATDAVVHAGNVRAVQMSACG